MPGHGVEAFGGVGLVVEHAGLRKGDGGATVGRANVTAGGGKGAQVPVKQGERFLLEIWEVGFEADAFGRPKVAGGRREAERERGSAAEGIGRREEGTGHRAERSSQRPSAECDSISKDAACGGGVSGGRARQGSLDPRLLSVTPTA